jgi:hypothetical protein
MITWGPYGLMFGEHRSCRHLGEWAEATLLVHLEGNLPYSPLDMDVYGDLRVSVGVVHV